MTENLEKRLKELEADCKAAFENDQDDLKAGLTHCVLSALCGSVANYENYPEFLQFMARDAHQVAQAGIILARLLGIKCDS